MSFVEKFEKYSVVINGVQLPRVIVDEKYYNQYGIDKSANTLEFLKKLCNYKFKEMGLDKLPNKKDYLDRVKMEMGVIEELGYESYFIMVWDVVNFAKENNIATGHGRGSAVGSLVMYLIGVTKVDPVKHNLFFERFISKARAKSTIIDGVKYYDGSLLCDVDTDFDYYRRQEVIAYINQKYPSRTSKILTTSTLQGKAVIKEVAKICGSYEEHEVSRLSDEIETKFGKVDKISEAFEKSDYLKEWLNTAQEKYRPLSNRRIYEIAQKIEGLPRNFGVHASAIAVTFDKMEDACPTQKTKDGEIVSGFDMKWMAEIAVKLDVLGLKTLSVVDDVCRTIGVKMENINYEDKCIYEYLQDFKSTKGIFQLEADSQGSAARAVKPADIGELSDVLAIARPGAMSYLKDYIKVKKGEIKLPVVHPVWDKILAQTKGVSAYQEQMMQLGNQVFGFSLEQAETLRRVVGKKAVKDMEAWKPKVYENAEKQGLPKAMADAYWKLLEESANYSFNRCIWVMDTVETQKGEKKIGDIKVGEYVKAYNTESKEDHFVEVMNKFHSKVDLYEVELEDGKKITTSLRHRHLCEDGQYHSLSEILDKKYKIITK